MDTDEQGDPARQGYVDGVHFARMVLEAKARELEPAVARHLAQGLWDLETMADRMACSDQG